MNTTNKVLLALSIIGISGIASADYQERCTINMQAESGYTITIHKIECKPISLPTQSNTVKKQAPSTAMKTGEVEAKRIMGYTDYFGITIKNGVYTVPQGGGLLHALGLQNHPYNQGVIKLLKLIQSELNLENINQVPAGFKFEVLPDRIRRS